MTDTQHTRYAILTGAAGGLGRALALRLADEGWTIALCDLNREGLRETAGLVERRGGTGEIHRLDVAEPAEWAALRTDLQSRWPRLDLLVNNAGVSSGGEVTGLSAEDWQWVLGINLHGVIHGCHTFIPWLCANDTSRGGHIINTASLAGFLNSPAMGAYNVGKAGVIALSETLYAELAPRNVGVTVLCPAFFLTNLLEQGRFEGERHRKVGRRYMEASRFTADDVARRALHAMRRKQLYVVHGRRARALWRFKRWAPRSFHRLAARLYGKYR